MGWFLTIVQLRRAWLVSTDGIALATWCTFIFATIFWTWYGFAVHDPVVLWSSLVIFPIQAAIIAKIEKRGEGKTILAAAAFVFVTCGLPTMLWGWSAGCYGAGVLMILNRWPQIKTLLVSSEVEGVSVASWSIGTVSLFLWVLYYSEHNKWAPLVASGGAAIGNVAIVVLATWRHRQHRQAHLKDSVGPLAG
jgi:uncharacterized protein with PQ loop repeat